MSDNQQLETYASELIDTFEIKTPPVPVESMLHDPKEGMWEQVDVTQLSGTFLSFSSQYSPRMSLARMLVRHIMTSEWGKSRQLDTLIGDDDTLAAFARMIIMPQEMVKDLSSGGRNPTTMSLQFEVPEEDARMRLQDMLG